MPFVEMTGATLERIITDGELHHEDLESAGVRSDSIVRVNEQGDVEVRRPEGWDVIGGLLGDYQHRVTQKTGLKWA